MSNASTAQFEAELLSLIDRYLADDMTFVEFEDKFYDLYYDDIRGEDLDGEAEEWFSEVGERSSYTSPDDEVDEESFGFGWRTSVVYKEWLADHRSRFPRIAPWPGLFKGSA